MNNKRPKRIIAALLALIMMLSTGIIVLAEDYGMQGSKRKLQMTEPANIVVNTASETDYDNTINSPVVLTDGIASFQFKMDALGGQTTDAEDPVEFLQGKVDSDVTITDAAGNTVTGTKLLVTAVDKTAFTFDLGISGLSFGTSYVLTFKSSFTTGGPNWAIGVNIKFNFTTAVDPEAPYIQGATANAAVPPRGISHQANYGYGQVDSPWNQDEIGLEIRINPTKVLANEFAEENYKQFSLVSYYGEEIPITVGPGRNNNNYSFYKVNMSLPEQGWYCLTVGKDFKNNAGKTIGDYTGGEGQTYWILKPTSRTTNGNTTIYLCVDLTTNLQNITYEDTSAFNGALDQGKVAMNYQDITCPDYLVKLTPVEGYALPSELSISVNGKELTEGKDYTYTPTTLQTETGLVSAGEYGEHEYNLKVDRHAINGPVIITAAAVKPDYVAPALVSSKGNDLIAKTYTDLELKNAPGEGYLYKFIVYNETTKQWYKLQDFSDATTFSWYTGPEGVKNLYVDIKSKSDETDVTRIELTGVNVTDSNLKVETFTIVPGGELATKTQATLAATASGGEGEYQYKFIVYNSTTQQWYKLKDFGPESTFDWYTGPVGEKTLYVDVKDGTGKVVRESLSVSVQ